MESICNQVKSGIRTDYMEPVDKFGSPIYPRLYNKLKRYGDILESLGYRESIRNPNLFYLNTPDVKFWADMRGTKECRIWEAPIPYLYGPDLSKNLPRWKGRRYFKSEQERLKKAGCPTRLSFYNSSEPDGLMFDLDEDGYCKQCGKDYQDDGLFCSASCKEIFEKRQLARYINRCPACSVCGRKIISKYTHQKIVDYFGLSLPVTTVRHHLSYEDDKTITVCNECHAKIHHSKDPTLESLRPPTARPKKQRKYTFGKCSKCGGRARQYPESPEPLVCSKCKDTIICKQCGERKKIHANGFEICYECDQKLRRKGRTDDRPWDIYAASRFK